MLYTIDHSSLNIELHTVVTNLFYLHSLSTLQLYKLVQLALLYTLLAVLKLEAFIRICPVPLRESAQGSSVIIIEVGVCGIAIPKAHYLGAVVIRLC